MSDFHSPDTIHEGDPNGQARHEIIEREASQLVYNRRVKDLTPIVVKYRQCGCVTWDHVDE